MGSCCGKNKNEEDKILDNCRADGDETAIKQNTTDLFQDSDIISCPDCDVERVEKSVGPPINQDWDKTNFQLLAGYMNETNKD